MIGLSDHQFALQAAIDAGNRSMRAAGRTRWNADDDSAARLQYELLNPSPANESARDALRRLVLIAQLIRRCGMDEALAGQIDQASGAAIGVLTST